MTPLLYNTQYVETNPFVKSNIHATHSTNALKLEHFNDSIKFRSFHHYF